VLDRASVHEQPSRWQDAPPTLAATEIARSDAFVFFGATGDLAFKKIFPALLGLIRDEQFELPIIGVARSGDLDSLRERARQSVTAHGAVDPAATEKLLALLGYVKGSSEEADTFTALRRELGGAAHALHYLAIPPSLFAPVIDGLQQAGCADGARVILEKPFGRDLASAQELNATVRRVFPEDSVFRIDHFLGKECVQNLLYFRFANAFVESVWNRDRIASVQITMAEAFDVADRGAFYDEVGAIRDVVQNHLLQVVSLLAMEPPSGQSPEAVRNEQFKILDSIRPLVPADVVCGQYGGYRDVKGVAPGSDVETFAALRLRLDTWRWAGVPFYVRTGKSLPVTATEVLVELRRPPLDVFGEAEPAGGDYFRFRLSPDMSISLGARVKTSGDAMVGDAVELAVSHKDIDARPPYQRLIGDAIRGDHSLFTRGDAVEAAWRVVDGVLGGSGSVREYEPGSWGPADADGLLERGHHWRDPTVPRPTEPTRRSPP
jgi:glucose-6-phosphate 1-dehydrogenase